MILQQKNSQNTNHIGTNDSLNESNLVDPDCFLNHVNDLFIGLQYKVEPVRDGYGKTEFSEVLMKHDNIPEFLAKLKATNRTFELFQMMFYFSVLETNNNSINTSINVFLKDFNHPDFINIVESYEDEYDTCNSKIIFEILEYNYGVLNDTAINNLRILKNKGFKIAIDDFVPILGIDNKSLEVLQTLLKEGIIPDYVKIDGGYLQDILTGNKSEDDIQMLRNFILLLKDKGIKIVGEWVGSDEEGKNAKELGIDLFQGFNLNDEFSIEERTNVKSFRFDPKAKSFKLHKSGKLIAADDYHDKKSPHEEISEVKSFKLNTGPSFKLHRNKKNVSTDDYDGTIEGTKCSIQDLLNL